MSYGGHIQIIYGEVINRQCVGRKLLTGGVVNKKVLRYLVVWNIIRIFVLMLYSFLNWWGTNCQGNYLAVTNIMCIFVMVL